MWPVTNGHTVMFATKPITPGNRRQKPKHSKKYIELELTSQDNLDKFAAKIKASKICERINSNADADPNANLDILTHIISPKK